MPNRSARSVHGRNWSRHLRHLDHELVGGVKQEVWMDQDGRLFIFTMASNSEWGIGVIDDGILLCGCTIESLEINGFEFLGQL